MLRVGSKFTAIGDGPDRHFEVISLSRDRVELRCVVSGRSRHIDRAALTNDSEWQPGWHSTKS